MEAGIGNEQEHINCGNRSPKGQGSLPLELSRDNFMERKRPVKSKEGPENNRQSDESLSHVNPPVLIISSLYPMPCEAGTASSAFRETSRATFASLQSSDTNQSLAPRCYPRSRREPRR